MVDYTGPASGTDPFSRFWVDLMSQMSGAAGRAQMGTPQEEVSKQMRQAFFDSWAKYCDDFMRSEAFLGMMKKSMDNALAMKQQVNEFLTKALHENQIPARSDTDSILLVLRSLEERVLDRIERLSKRLDGLERGSDVSSSIASSAPAKPRPKGASK